MNVIQEELEKIMQRLSGEQLKSLLDYARKLDFEQLSPEEKNEFDAGQAEIARGEWVDWDELRKELDV